MVTAIGHPVAGLVLARIDPDEAAIFKPAPHMTGASNPIGPKPVCESQMELAS